MQREEWVRNKTGFPCSSSLVSDGFLLAPVIWRKSRERVLADKGGRMPCAWVEKTVWYKCAYRGCWNSTKPSTFLGIAICTTEREYKIEHFFRRGMKVENIKTRCKFLNSKFNLKWRLKCLQRKKMESLWRLFTK